MLIPKEGCKGKPHQYSPITCLNIIIIQTYDGHCFQCTVLSPCNGSRGHPCRTESLGERKERMHSALHLDKMIASEVKHCNENLSVAWIDYQKAFDRVPHLWIHCLLKAIKAPRAICWLLKYVIPLWTTAFTLGKEVSFTIQLRRGIFLGDSITAALSALQLHPFN